MRGPRLVMITNHTSYGLVTIATLTVIIGAVVLDYVARNVSVIQ